MRLVGRSFLKKFFPNNVDMAVSCEAAPFTVVMWRLLLHWGLTEIRSVLPSFSPMYIRAQIVGAAR